MLKLLENNANTISQTLMYELMESTRTFTYDEYKEIVNKDADLIRYIPYELQTKELCEIAVSKNGANLYHIAYHLRTHDLYKIAICEWARALRYVPEELRTKELCTLAIEKNCNALEFVPTELQTEELYKYAVSNFSNALQYIPRNLHTKELVDIAKHTYFKRFGSLEYFEHLL